jgi:alpha-aminoadipate/glutamate carrier protein LysW
MAKRFFSGSGRKTAELARSHLTNRHGESKYYQEALIGEGGFMVLCPECDTNLDVEEDDVEEGEVISCPECGTDFEIVTTSPLELKAVEEGYEEEEELEEETEDGDNS